MVAEKLKQVRYEPKILMFACNWCAYAGLDLAGTSRLTYPANVTVIRTMCSWRIDPSFVIRALTEGVDGVLIGMCNYGDCHYINGNYKAMKRFLLLQKMLTDFGIEHERIRIEGISASEALKAKKVITEMVETLRGLGPLEIMEE